MNYSQFFYTCGMQDVPRIDDKITASMEDTKRNKKKIINCRLSLFFNGIQNVNRNFI